MSLSVNNFPIWVVERLRRYYDLFVSDVRKINNTNPEFIVDRTRATFSFSAPSDSVETAKYRHATSNSVRCSIPDHILQIRRDGSVPGVVAERTYTAISQYVVTITLPDEANLLTVLSRSDSASRLAALRDQFVIAFLSATGIIAEFPSEVQTTAPVVPSQPEQSLFEVHTAFRTDDPSLLNELSFGSLVISGSGILFEREAGVFPVRENVKSQAFTQIIPPVGDEPFSYELQLDAYPMALKNGPLFFYDMVTADSMSMDDFIHQIHLPYLRSNLLSYVNSIGYADPASYYGIIGLQWLSWFPWWSSTEAASPPDGYPNYAEDWEAFLAGDAENSWYSTFKIPQFWETTVSAALDTAPNSKTAFVGLLSTMFISDDIENGSRFETLQNEVPNNQDMLNLIGSQSVLLPTVVLNGNVKVSGGDESPVCAAEEDVDEFTPRAILFSELINQYHALFPSKPVYLAITVGIPTSNLFDDPEATDVCEVTTSTWNAWLGTIFSQCPYIKGVYLYLPFKINSGNIDAVSTSLANVVGLLELYQRNGI